MESSTPEIDVFKEKGDGKKIRRSRERRAGCQNPRQFLETSGTRLRTVGLGAGSGASQGAGTHFVSATLF